MDTQSRPMSNLSLAPNIRNLESVTDCFICSLCFRNSGSESSFISRTPLLPNGTVTSDPVVFENHLTTCHKPNTLITCFYCDLKVLGSHLISHIIGHLLIPTNQLQSNSFCGLLACPNKSGCPTQFRTRHLNLLKLHLEVQHNDQDHKQSGYCCSECQHQFSQLSQWFDHVKRYSKLLVHCTEPGCFVKSPSRELIMDHIHRKHSSKLASTNLSGSSLIRETIEMLCDRNELYLPSQTDHSLTASLSNLTTSSSIAPTPNMTTNGIPNNNQSKSTNCIYPEFAPQLVFLLRCPYCDLTTLRWHHFLMHPANCPSLDYLSRNSKSTDLIYRCHIYWCSECQALSTERNLLKEHVTYFHDSKAFVFREHLRIALINSSGNTVKRKAVESPVSTNAATTASTPQDPSASENSEPESLLNLAALARPSASKLIYYSNRTIQPISLVSPTPILAASSPIPSVPITTQLTTVNTNVSMPVLNGVAAFKTFQNLTANGHEVSNLTASEAASAMAAMAAAALSGLTNFNITKPVPPGSNLATISSTMPVVTIPDPNYHPIEKTIPIEPLPSSFPTINTTILTTTTTATPASASSNSIPLISPPKLSYGPQDPGSKPLIKLEQPNQLAPPQLTPSPAQQQQQQHQEQPKVTPTDNCGRNASEVLVSFPFDEQKFRQELANNLRPPIIDVLATKMRQFSTYYVRIIGKENHRRIPVCPECEKVFPYGLGDFKRHLLTVHLEIPRQHLKDCLRFTYLPKSEEKFQEFQEQLTMRQMKPRLLEPGRRRVPLPYSIRILRRLISQFPIGTREFLEQKMQLYSRLSVIVDSRGGFRRFKCNHCSYTSPHGLGDVRKHILGSHCGVATKYFRHCLQASRLDPVEFTLLSDDKLARLARDFVRRRQISKTQSQRSKSPELESMDSNSNRTPNSPAPCSTPTASKSQETYVSHFTAVVPGSKNKVTVRIRPPIPPDNNSASSNLSQSSSSTPPPQSSAVNLNGSVGTGNGSNTPNPTSLSSISPGNQHGENPNSSATQSLDLSYFSTVPGMEGADRLIELSLPFSEPVLRQLLESSRTAPKQIEDLVSKMKIYSSYKMTRICCGDRTLAFRCPCGRLFITTRQPDRKIRAATLADSRRHVMGVHARVPNAFITVCCQASRITKEYDFQIYPDEMLLRLATDRPVKFTNSISEIVPAPPPPVPKPLKELAPHPNTTANLTMTTAVTTTTTTTVAHLSTTSTSSGTSSPHIQPLYEGDSMSEDVDHMSMEDVEDEDYNPDLMMDTDNGELNEEDEDDKKEPEGDPLSHLIAAQTSSTEEVERVIDLPFSSEALYNLVQGYCPANYFPILEAKMNTYSSLKVYITRRRGRRYFCCSGCPSASPHGMGDIRKHILGVHAKVPERYKAAAMHCSRLSREDNSLLPNHVLLHLAKMKWKGTVIKPLSEIDLTQYGSKRAMAMGLSRTSGQFASQVYQPTTHREAEMRLSMSRSELHSSTSKYQPSKSPSPHLDTSTTASTATLLPDKTDNSSDNINHSDQMFYVLRKRINASEDDTTSQLGDSTNYIYACSACQFSSGYVGGLKAHIVRVHLGLPVRKCAYCDATFKARIDALLHHRAVHHDLEFFADHQPMDYHNAISKIAVKDIEETTTTNGLGNSSSLSKMIPSGQNSTADRAKLDLTLEDSFEDDDEEEDNQTRPANRSGLLGSHGQLDTASCEDQGKPAKRPRLSVDTLFASLSPNTSSPASNDVPYKDTKSEQHSSTANSPNNDLSSTTNHKEVSNGNSSSNGKTNGASTAPVLRTALSGSSRRKPSKLQLVQLRPADYSQSEVSKSGPKSAQSPESALNSNAVLPPDIVSSSSSSSTDDPDALEFSRLASIPPILGSIKNRIGV